MNVEDRLARLERRFMVLEALVRRGLPSVPLSEVPEEATPPAELPPPAPAVPHIQQPEPAVPQPVGRRRAVALSIEQWFGQRGVLAVGVLLLILAAAYFLKIAIDRGWISPAARCIAAVVAGVAVALVGWRTYRRGTETFGATLIGAGFGMVYLAIWASASWYALITPEVGIIGLAVVSLATSAIAYQLDIEALGAAAAVGALMGPIVIATTASSTDVLLLYLGGVGGSLGFTAVRRDWHATALLIVVVSLFLALPAVAHANPILAYSFGLLAGMTCLSLRRRWVEIGVIGFLGAWGIFVQIPAQASTPWLVIACAVLLAVPIWRRSFGTGIVWPADGGVTDSGERWSLAESLLFYLVPVMIGATIAVAYPPWTAAHPGAGELLLAVPYLVVGYVRIGSVLRSQPTFAFVGTSAAALAAFHWPLTGVGAVITMLGLALLWPGLDHVRQRSDGRWYALFPLVGAGIRFAAIVRAPDGAAFADSWALTLWLGIGVLGVLALGLWKVARAEDGTPGPKVSVRYQSIDQDFFRDLVRTLPPDVRSLLWVVAGVLLFGGVTNELARLMGQRGFSPEVVPLARGLAVSTWWALFAGGLVVFGFYRRLPPARIAGLSVAALAVVKVLFFDLANLDQLYRVGSFIVLAVVLLCVAYLYHRQAARVGGEPPDT